MESLQASPSATTRQVAQSFLNRPFDTKAHDRQNSFIRRSTCPQCLETAVRFLLALDLKLNDKVNPTHYAWQAGVERSMFDAFSPPKEDSLVSFSI